ncbi:ABC transporter ATP-binding protein, partial [Streptococcus danieliae]|nr:ABC transporter ATP-binding protein [Streptococcus danieliae]
MDKHRRQKAQVRHSLINTHDATAGRLVAKKMKQVLGRERRFEQQREELTQAPLDEEAIQLFFSNIQPLPAKKSLL